LITFAQAHDRLHLHIANLIFDFDVLLSPQAETEAGTLAKTLVLRLEWVQAKQLGSMVRVKQLAVKSEPLSIELMELATRCLLVALEAC
jgi:hypothetical protein